MVFPPTAPWWSAGLTTPQGSWRAFRWQHGVMQDLGTLGGNTSVANGVSAGGAVVVGGASNAAGRVCLVTLWVSSGRLPSATPFAGRKAVGCKTSARWAAVVAGLMVFPPTAPWWSAGLTTPQRQVVPFAGRRRVACKTSARWAAIGAWLMVFPPTAPWWSAGLTTPQGSGVPFAGRRRWHARPRHAGRR
jgi:hypothetical protein